MDVPELIKLNQKQPYGTQLHCVPVSDANMVKDKKLALVNTAHWPLMKNKDIRNTGDR